MSIDYVPCVLKLDKRKFVCYVEEYVDHVAPLSLAADAVKIFSKRKKAWRAATATALALARSDNTKPVRPGSKSSGGVRI